MNEEMKFHTNRILLYTILGFVTWTSIFDDVSAQTSCVIGPNITTLTIRNPLTRTAEFNCQCMDGNGIITGTRWFGGNTSVSQSDTDRPYSTNTVPSRLIFSNEFTDADIGTYTCSPNNMFPTIPPGDAITLSARTDPGRDNVQTNCSIISTSLPTVTAAGGVIANGTNNVTLYCICYRSNIAVGPTWWYFNGIQVTLTEDNGSGDPYYRDNVPSALIIPSFVTGHDGNYSCGNLNININDISLHGDTIILTLPVAAPRNFRYTSVTSNSITFQWNSFTEDVQVSWYVITCFEGSITFTTNVTGTSTMGSVDGLSPFTNYSCTIHAVIMTSDGLMSDPIVVRTAEAAPSPPVINEVTAIDSTSVRVEWSIPTNPNGILTNYIISYNIEGGSSRTINVSYNGQLTQSYDITGLSPYQLVTVTITATNGVGTSNPSVVGDGRSGEAAAGVVEIARVVGTSDNTAIVFWAPPSQPNGVITGYQIIYSLYGDSTNSMNHTVASNEDSFVITNLSTGIPYQVVVVAFNSRGSGAENQPQTFFSQELMPTDSLQNVTFDRISGEYVNISWDAPSLSEARGFPVYKVTLTPSTSNNGQQITNGVIVVNTTESSIVVGGLNVNVEYVLTVAVGTTAGQIMSNKVLVIMKPTSQTSDGNDDSNTSSVIFIVLLVISAVINILLTIVIIYFVVKTRKTSYSPNNAANIYDAVGLYQQNIKKSSIDDYEVPSVSSSGKISSTTTSKQDTKADTVALQENPSYVATN